MRNKLKVDRALPFLWVKVSSSMITVWTGKGRRWLHSLDLANYPTLKQRKNNEEFCDYDETGERNIY